jgi:hypothetical protein
LNGATVAAHQVPSMSATKLLAPAHLTPPHSSSRFRARLWGGAGLSSEEPATLADARVPGAVALLTPFTAAGLAAAVRRSIDRN